MLASPIRWLVLTSLTLALGCGSKGPNAPAAPGGGSVSTRGGTPGANKDAGASSDGGPRKDAGDSGSALAALECVDVPPAPFMGENMPGGQLLNAISSPSDFVVTRVKASWDKSCMPPMIRIELSDGACPNGSGHALVFTFDADAIKSMEPTIRLGQNSIAASNEPDGGIGGIVVRYVRPRRLTPNGTWGNCDNATGTVDLIGDLDTVAGTMFEGRFDMELSSCDMTMLPPETLVGSFSALLRQGEAQACPGK